MYNIRLVTEKTEAYKGYMSEDIFAGFNTTDNRFLLTADDGKKTVGVCVFDAAAVTRIVEIGITADCQKRKKLRRAFLHAVIGICEKLKAKVLTISLYDEDDFSEWEEVLDETRFELDSRSEFYRFRLKSLFDNAAIEKLKSKDGVTLLEDISSDRCREIDTFLKETGIYRGFDIEEVRRDFSSVYIEDDEIKGLLLISYIRNGICVEYAYTSGDDISILPGLIKCSVNAVADDDVLYGGAVGELVCINKESSDIFLKLLPKCEKFGEQRTYYTVIGEES